MVARPIATWYFALCIAALLPSNQSAWGQTARPELIAFKSGDLELKAFIWKPSGNGPFPALLWNHGSEKSPGSIDTVAPYFVDKGYVFFVQHRRGQGRSPGPYIMDELNQGLDQGVNAANFWLISTKPISMINWLD
jgi:X-Pro dipeptidyl-peptidase-like protein